MRNPNCTACPLHASANHVCLMGHGPARAEIMIIGEAPGKEEDAQGLPFVGNAGKLLDELLDQVNLDRDDIYITNAVKCRPPNNEKPSAGEIAACRRYLQLEISSVRPRHILLMGASALKAMTGEAGIMKERGRPSMHNGVIVMPTLHPAAIFYTPANRAIVEQDLRYFKGLMRRGFIPPAAANVRPRLVSTHADVAEMLKALTGVVSIDLETGPRRHIDKSDARQQRANLSKAERAAAVAERELQRQQQRLLRQQKRVAALKRPDAIERNLRKQASLQTIFEQRAADHAAVEAEAMQMQQPPSTHDLKAQKRDGLYPWFGQITAFGFGTAVGEFCVLANHAYSPWSRDDIDDILAEAVTRLEKCYLVGQNVKFDQLYLKVHHGINLEVAFDTMLAHYLLDENQFHDLEYIARLYFNAPAWDIPLEDKHGAGTDAELVNYLAHDLYYTRRLFDPLNTALSSDPQLYRLFHHLLMPLANLFVRIEAHGAYIDHPRLRDAQKFLNDEITKAEEALRSYANINWSSTAQVADVLYKKLHLRVPKFTPKGAPSTDESSLNQIDHPVAGAIKRMRAAKQEYGLFIKGWGPYLTPSLAEQRRNSIDSSWRLHPNFKLSGTVTGRASAEHPNLQQTTREARVRSLIIAPPGWELWEADLSQIELRLIAEVSRDPTMMECFLTGRDIHWTTALREIERGVGHVDLVLSTASKLSQRKVDMYGDAIQILLDAGPDAAAEIDKKWKDLRYGAKAVNFGFSFGMWWKRFKLYARDTYGLEITDRQAEQSRRAFFQLYSRLPDWHELQKRLARLQGHVRSLCGQKRRLPDAQSPQDTPEKQEAFRQAINSPIQCFAAKINWMILLQLTEEFSWSIFRPVATVHDSILAEVRSDHIERVTARYLEIVKHPALFDTLDISLSVPLDGECKIGPWGSGVSVSKWLASQRALGNGQQNQGAHRQDSPPPRHPVGSRQLSRGHQKDTQGRRIRLARSDGRSVHPER
jgi:uracil-DNA glycosylase family 4